MFEFEGLVFPMEPNEIRKRFRWSLDSHPLDRDDYRFLIGKTLVVSSFKKKETQYRPVGRCGFTDEDEFDEIEVEVPILHIEGSSLTLTWESRFKEFRSSKGRLLPEEVIVIPTEGEWQKKQLILEVEKEGCSSWQELSAKRLKEKADKEAAEKAEELAKQEREKAREAMVSKMQAHLEPLMHSELDLWPSGFGFKLKRKGDWITLCSCYLIENNWDASLEAVQKLIDFSNQWTPPAPPVPPPPSTIQKVREELLKCGLFTQVIIHKGKKNRIELTLQNKEKKEYEFSSANDYAELIQIKNILLKDVKPGRPMPKKKVK